MNEEEEESLRALQAATVGKFWHVERIRLGVLVIYGCSIGVLVAIWPPNVWVWILFALQTAVIIVLFVLYFPIYTLGEAISADEDEE